MAQHADDTRSTSRATSCSSRRHVDAGGICRDCGEWLPTATCREPGCGWTSAVGARTHEEAVRHLCGTGHAVRVLIN